MTEDDRSSVQEHLARLAPRNLPRGRADRYAGEGFAVSLDAFAAGDVRRIRTVYQRCQTVYEAWLRERDRSEWPEVDRALAVFRDQEFVEDIQLLGHDTASEAIPPEVAQVLHDVRSGGLAGLVAQAEVADMEAGPGPAREAVLLARDHAKMMRQAIVDVDPAGREADSREARHEIGDVAGKWERERYSVDGSVARVAVDCRAGGGLASRCLEAAAVDRILYNLINNATRFAADRRVELHILDQGDDVRFVVVNRITPDQERWLERETGGDPGRLFLGGRTRGGHGIGLLNCAQFVAAAYGQVGPADVVDAGHIGARVMDGVYHAWFHWPRYDRSRYDGSRGGA